VDSEKNTAQALRKSDYEELFANEIGERVLSDLFDNFHMARSTHVNGDSHETAYREGQRNVVLHILHLLGKRSDISWLNGILDQGELQYARIQEFE
jgi:hypothetical protein|tara:strand:+ start:679 stop:966 length:288 start_codon:yes stop_codon:yes gene_type:complete